MQAVAGDRGQSGKKWACDEFTPINTTGAECLHLPRTEFRPSGKRTRYALPGGKAGNIAHRDGKQTRKYRTPETGTGKHPAKETEST